MVDSCISKELADAAERRRRRRQKFRKYSARRRRLRKTGAYVYLV